MSSCITYRLTKSLQDWGRLSVQLRPVHITRKSGRPPIGGLLAQLCKRDGGALARRPVQAWPLPRGRVAAGHSTLVDVFMNRLRFSVADLSRLEKEAVVHLYAMKGGSAQKKEENGSSVLLKIVWQLLVLFVL